MKDNSIAVHNSEGLNSKPNPANHNPKFRVRVSRSIGLGLGLSK